MAKIFREPASAAAAVECKVNIQGWGGWGMGRVLLIFDVLMTVGGVREKGGGPVMVDLNCSR